MFKFSSILPSIPKFGLGRANSANAINIPSVEVHDVETSTDKRDRRLKHLLKLNHANFSILWNHLRFHNHTPHLLGSAYLMNGSADHLTEIYEHAVTEGHESWQDSPSEIALHDYRDFLSKREYQRAWVDFFEDQLVDHNYDWKEVAARFLFERGDKNSANRYPLFACLTAGLGHPLIHLGYAYELSSREVGMEALGLAATCYDPKLAALLENNLQAKPDHEATTTDIFTVFDSVRTDSRFDKYFDRLGNDNLFRLLGDDALVGMMLEHFHSWSTTNSKSAFEQSQRFAAALLISTSPQRPINGHGYDFFLLHILTTSHAVRILIPFLPAEHHVPLLQQWFLITLALYIAQLRPAVSKQMVTNYDLAGRGWDDACKLALESEHKFDEHYVKGIRALKEAAMLWGDNDAFFEKAAVRFAREFDEWKGFSQQDEENVKKDAQGRNRRASFDMS